MFTHTGSNLSENNQNIILVSSCLPRKCGIATFSDYLRNALIQCDDIDNVSTIAVNNNTKYHYPKHVCYEINQDKLEDYYQAAQFVNASQADVVSLQHEFGLFGGSDGRYIRVFLKHIRKPVVTTFHTMPQNPSTGQKDMIREIADHSDVAVVMNSLAIDIMETTYQIPSSKISVIPHGVNLIQYQHPSYYKQRMALQDHLLILTFGFLSPNKGIETMLQALPSVIEECPHALYMILGMTHPVERKHNGETYRKQLEKIVEDLGLEDHVMFIDHYVDDEDMDSFIGAADIIVCPYHSQDQITSGVLSTALSRGKAIISTPILHAKETLTMDRGILVPPKDPASMAQAVIRLGTSETVRSLFGENAYAFSRQLGWDQISLKYNQIFKSSTPISATALYENAEVST